MTAKSAGRGDGLRMRDSTFERLRCETIPALHLVMESYQHLVTGARHLHLAAEDSHNAFLVAFLTVPEDSSGVAHILEHTVLCGSERYPVRDPFFMMLRRTLATFMNAFTSGDWTAYPFATQSRKDFVNLLQVYLDAAFFPRLDDLDCDQEGCRLELLDPDRPDSPLVYKGVVFNEMKGAMSSPSRVMGEKIATSLFDTSPYRFNSGGDPEEIPRLTREQIRAFHARHYHPSNAVFMTYGDIPAADHQQIFESSVLRRFDRPAERIRLDSEVRRHEPKRIEATYAVSPDEPLRGKTQVVVSWLLGRSFEVEELLSAHLLSGVLLDNSSSPLLHALETTELGSAPASQCELDDSMREMVFSCGLEGSEAERAPAVEELIEGVIARVATEGVEPERVAAVFHQMELSRREIGGDHLPYGLQLMLQALMPALHDGDPVAALALDPVLDKLRGRIEDPEFIKGLARRMLLDNGHRGRVILRPDPSLNAAKQAREEAQLAVIRQAMTPQDLERIRERALDLAARQRRLDDPDVLPRLELEDVPTELPIPDGRTQLVAGQPVTWYNQPTNGLVYQQVVVDLPNLDPELLDWLPMYAYFLSEVGSGGRDYLETQALQSQVSGGLSARVMVQSRVDNLQELRGSLVVSGKALIRNSATFMQLMRETVLLPRFDESIRLRELVARSRVGAESRLSDHGHSLAMSAAVSGMSKAAALADRFGGLSAIKRLKRLDESLERGEGLDDMVEALGRLHGELREAPQRVVLIGEESSRETLFRYLEEVWDSGASPRCPSPATGKEDRLLAYPPVRSQVKVGWLISSQVHFCAKGYPAVPYDDPDAPALTVLGHFLKNGFLHRAIRERGGAYGIFAGYDADAGAFRFGSYRDPRLSETLADLDASVQWMLEERHDDRPLEEAILGVIAAIDRPGSPAGNARRAFHAAYFGRTPTKRRFFRRNVLRVTLADLQRVAGRYLRPERASVAVVSHAGGQEEMARLGLTLQVLSESS